MGRRRPAGPLVDYKARVIAIGRTAPADGATMDALQVAHRGVLHVRRYRIAHLTAERAAEPINAPGEPRLDLQNRAAQRFAFDEVVRQLVERAVEIVIEASIALEHADQDLPLASVIAIEGKARAL